MVGDDCVGTKSSSRSLHRFYLSGNALKASGGMELWVLVLAPTAFFSLAPWNGKDRARREHLGAIDDVEKLKEQYAFCAEDEAAYEKTKQSCPNEKHTLPDGQVITIGRERYTVGEALFQPSILGLEANGLVEQLVHCILSVSSENHRQLLENTVLCGATSSMAGFENRFQKEAYLSPSAIHPTVVKFSKEEEFVDPQENCSSIQVDSDPYSDSISQFGPARDPHNFEIPSDLSYDEKDESYYLTPIGALGPLGGGLSEETLAIAVATVTQFHHVEDPGDPDNDGQIGGKALVLSVIPATNGKPTAIIEKSTIRDGCCYWENPVYETVKFVQDAKTGKFHDRIYNFIITTGSPTSSLVGEASVNIVVYVNTTSAAIVSFPFKSSISEGVLHVSIQRVQENDCQRDLDESKVENTESGNKTLKRYFSNGDAEEGTKTNSTEDEPLRKTMSGLNGNSRASSGSDITLSNSGSSSGLNTPRELAVKNNDTMNASNYQVQHRVQWEWSLNTADDSTRDDTTNSSRDAFVIGRSQLALDNSVLCVDRLMRHGNRQAAQETENALPIGGGYGLESSGPLSSAAEEGRGEEASVVLGEDEPPIHLPSNAPASYGIKCLFVIWWPRRIITCSSLQQPPQLSDLLVGLCVKGQK
ncbi:hypothetical protein Nepgr_003316 [Nepenthes gracilis]|uniref:C2 NT-type domain-containing protein n=1 Tax=Nepenthes gracilis TaxID=150966 RepID=A0AAD3RZB8_NEPGR|nr:hypothetical protein Nepgr_003316 [Nepenthes gracilis]